MNHRRRPDFVGIGAQKAGTTWLAQQLADHPGVFIPGSKELHFLDWLDLAHPRSYRGRSGLATWHGRFYRREARRARQTAKALGWNDDARRLLAYHYGPRSFASYRRVFPPAGAGLIRGEFTPDYGPVSPPSVDTFIERLPGLKVILVLRDPVERRWSNILHVLRAAERDPAAMTPSQLKEVLDNDRIGDYRAIIETWRPRLPDTDFGVFFHDDMASDPGRFLDDVLSFLGLAPGWRPADIDQRINVTEHLGSMPDEIRAWASTELLPLLDWLVDRFPDVDHPQRWRDKARTHAG